MNLVPILWVRITSKNALEFPNLHTTDTQIIICWGESENFPVHFRIFSISIIPSTHTTSLPVTTTKMSPDIHEWPMEVVGWCKTTPVKNHCTGGNRPQCHSPDAGGREGRPLETSGVQEPGIVGGFVFIYISAHHLQCRFLAEIHLAALSIECFPIMLAKHN